MDINLGIVNVKYSFFKKHFLMWNHLHTEQIHNMLVNILL